MRGGFFTKFAALAHGVPPSLSKLKVLPSFCFAFKIPDNVTASTIHTYVVAITVAAIVGCAVAPQ